MRSVWAVARVTVREALRQKAAVVLLVMLVVLLPALGLSVKGDATLPGRAQMFLDYSLRVSRLLLALMTVFTACGTLAWELKYKQAYITLVKPISRWQFLLGKWAGLGLLNLLLLAAVGLVIDGFAWNFRGRPRLSLAGGPHWVYAEMPEPTNNQQRKSQRDREILRKEVLTARGSLRPVPPTALISQEAEKTLKQLIDTGQLPPGQSERSFRANLFQRKLREYATVEPLGFREFRFTGLTAATRVQGDITIRYRIEAGTSTPNDMMSYRWMIGDPRKSERAYIVDRTNEPLRIVHKLSVPADAITPDGELLVTFVNVNPADPRATFPASATFVGDDASTIGARADPVATVMNGLEVLYPAGNFETNLLRALAMVWVQLLFLAALGLFAASFLTFPTACLLCLLFLSAGSGVDYVLEAMSWVHRDVSASVSSKVSLVTGPLVKAFLYAIPNFGNFTPSTAVVEGRLVSWSWLASAAVHVGLIRTTLVLLLGAWILTRREVAQVIV